ncbi:phage tail protein [Limobrevibacterium gyesilva]|uniref:Phage tail protein n=1 Tax=Limobrevibacterium gyesilva TaxID=2991712 RepID=A0AA41YRG9_9PROT|nr:phage tail protein [Limobrevibacterium gyesilva]MCW3477371.1 phage tail protein [Limobrevibacterium gyesilva]
MPQLIVAVAAAIASWGGAALAVEIGIAASMTSFAAVAIGAVTGSIVALGLSMLFPVSTPKASVPDVARDRKQTLRSGVAPKRIIYGTSLVSGPVVFMDSSGANNEYIHLVVPLAGHAIAAIDTVHLNNYVIDVNAAIGGVGSAGRYAQVFALVQANSGSGPVNVANVSTSGFPSGSDRDGYARFSCYDGTQVAADPDLSAELPARWNANYKLLGLPYIYARVTYSQDCFPGGFQSLRAQVRGKKVYDPRDGSTAFRNNAALCILDYLMSSDGLGATLDEIDLDYWIAAANLCDESVAIDVAGTVYQPRYTIDGSFTLDQAPLQIMEQLLSSCAGALTYVMGRYRLHVGAYDAPTVALGPSDFAGKVAILTKNPIRSQFNTVHGTYIDPAQLWSAVAFPQVQVADLVAEDGEVVPASIELPFAIDAYHAQRLARLKLLTSRAGQIQMTAPLKYGALRIAAWDTVSVTLPDVGWTNMVFRVASWKYDPVKCEVTAVMHSEDAAAYTWNAVDAQPPILSQSTDLVSPLVLPAVATPTLATGFGINNDGTVVPDIVVSFIAPAHPFITAVEIQWKKSTDVVWLSALVPLPATQHTIMPVIVGATYQVRCRGIAGLVRGPWSSIASTAGAGKSGAPASPTGATVTSILGGYSVSWIKPPDADLDAIEIYEIPAPYTGTYYYVGESKGGGAVVKLGSGDYISRGVAVIPRDTSGNRGDATFVGFVTAQQAATADIVIDALSDMPVATSTTRQVATAIDTWEDALTLSVFVPVAGKVMLDMKASLEVWNGGTLEAGGGGEGGEGPG